MAAPQKRMVIPVVLADKETFDIYTKFRMQMYRIHSETKNVSKNKNNKPKLYDISGGYTINKYDISANNLNNQNYDGSGNNQNY